MTAWTLAAIQILRERRQAGMSTRTLAFGFANRFTRDEVVEAIWATVRFGDDREALAHLRDVMQYRAANLPLVNGRPALREAPRAMFR